VKQISCEFSRSINIQTNLRTSLRILLRPYDLNGSRSPRPITIQTQWSIGWSRSILRIYPPRFLIFFYSHANLIQQLTTEARVTRKQFRKEKSQRLIVKNHGDPLLEKPIEACPERLEAAREEWKRKFLEQFPWHQSFRRQAA
jgi:hypothetical protein